MHCSQALLPGSCLWAHRLHAPAAGGQSLPTFLKYSYQGAARGTDAAPRPYSGGTHSGLHAPQQRITVPGPGAFPVPPGSGGGQLGHGGAAYGMQASIQLHEGHWLCLVHCWPRMVSPQRCALHQLHGSTHSCPAFRLLKCEHACLAVWPEVLVVAGSACQPAYLAVWPDSLLALALQAANGYQQQNRSLPAWPQRPQFTQPPLQSMLPHLAYPPQQSHQMHQPGSMVPQHNGLQPGQAFRPPYSLSGYQQSPMGYQPGARQASQSVPGAAVPVKTVKTNNADLFIVDDDEEDEEDLVQPSKRQKGEKGQAVPTVGSQGGVWGGGGKGVVSMLCVLYAAGVRAPLGP